MDCQAVVLAAGDGGLAGVDPHPYAKVDPLVPRVRGKRTLPRDRGRDRVLGPAEDDKECVALSPNAMPACVFEGGAQEAMVIREHADPPVAEPTREHRRALDVAQEEGECSAGRFHHVGPKRATARSGSPD
jgi:hypothetical protein